jgi:hypothetical protein
MELFDFWDHNLRFHENIHPADEKVLSDKLFAKSGFSFKFPPGPYFGPLKTAKIVFLYGNPGVDPESERNISDSNNANTLYNQLSGEENYPIQLSGWKSWFTRKMESSFTQYMELAIKNVAIFNCSPYASKNMDNILSVLNCLPSTWMAQNYLRNILLQDAFMGKRMLVICRAGSIWGVKTTLGCKNVLINRNRSWIDKENVAFIKKWFEDSIL